jgi:hypothetical protein
MSKEHLAFLTATQVGERLKDVFPASYGSFSSTQTQPIAVNSPTSLSYDTIDLTGGGVTLTGLIVPTPNISVASAGVYRVIISVQLNKSGGGGSSGDVYIWFAVDGVAVPNTATKTAVSNSVEQVMTVEVLLNLTANQRISVVASSTNGGEQILAEAPTIPSAPRLPSIITIVQRIA